TAGYGRRGREFYSPAQTGLYLSIVSPLPTDWTPDAAGFLTGAVAVMVSEEIQRLVPSEKIEIKWVNDLYLHDRKVAGVLTEGWLALDTPQPPKVIVGIGINLNPSEWPVEIADRATGITTQTVDRNQLVQRLLKRWPTVLATYRDERWLTAYRQRQCLIGKQVTLQYGQQLVTGTVQGIGDQYALQVATQTGVKAYGAGEVVKVKLTN
ncbi:MAG: biotin--[acetyl-CoA-carboxylase] ligase, partial [Limosilactobacillus sp.]|nr:biotin--[acetyl-CoA-carboxylase] ligase [Limosilactobacillus sp.]